MNRVSLKKYSYFLKTLEARILLCDGAMGTELQARGFTGAPDLANLEKDGTDKVMGIHTDYLEAGSDIIQTNTFGANPVKLKSYRLDTKTADINRNAVETARRAIELYEKRSASKTPHFIAGDVGPTGKLLEPSGELKYSQAVEIFSRQIEVLIENGVDFLLVETIMDLNEALAAVEAVRKISDIIPLACTMSFSKNGVTIMGDRAGESARRLLAAGCGIVGANCSIGSDSMLDVVKKMRDSRPDAKLIFQPNAGLPVVKGERTAYNETPEIMAENIKKYLSYSPSILGACCGSTPAHIKKIAGFIKS
jgi:methionine synthase I (cobalamin-dependent)